MVEMLRNGRLLVGFTFSTTEDAIECAADERARLGRVGWAEDDASSDVPLSES
jgi:hypothetical protein